MEDVVVEQRGRQQTRRARYQDRQESRRAYSQADQRWVDEAIARLNASNRASPRRIEQSGKIDQAMTLMDAGELIEGRRIL